MAKSRLTFWHLTALPVATTQRFSSSPLECEGSIREGVEMPKSHGSSTSVLGAPWNTRPWIEMSEHFEMAGPSPRRSMSSVPGPTAPSREPRAESRGPDHSGTLLNLASWWHRDHAVRLHVLRVLLIRGLLQTHFT